jgi:hypothetical protein
VVLFDRGKYVMVMDGMDLYLHIERLLHNIEMREGYIGEWIQTIIARERKMG